MRLQVGAQWHVRSLVLVIEMAGFERDSLAGYFVKTTDL